MRINFDPANMILYGTGDPIEALGVLAEHVVSVHCKDGDWPPKGVPGAPSTTLSTEPWRCGPGVGVRPRLAARGLDRLDHLIDYARRR